MPGSVGRFGVGMVPVCLGLSEVEGFGGMWVSQWGKKKTGHFRAIGQWESAWMGLLGLGSKSPLSPTSKSCLLTFFLAILCSPLLPEHFLKCARVFCLPVCLHQIPWNWVTDSRELGCRELNPDPLE